MFTNLVVVYHKTWSSNFQRIMQHQLQWRNGHLLSTRNRKRVGLKGFKIPGNISLFTEVKIKPLIREDHQSHHPFGPSWKSIGQILVVSPNTVLCVLRTNWHILWQFAWLYILTLNPTFDLSCYLAFYWTFYQTCSDRHCIWDSFSVWHFICHFIWYFSWRWTCWYPVHTHS